VELSGHPTHDLIDELVARGAIVVEGDRTGPDPAAVDRIPATNGGWLFVPDSVWDTGFD
jgi:hypothetical protein